MITSLYKPFQHWSETGTIWLYSDPHFEDKELAEGLPDRPDSETQVKMINSKVGKKDTLIILGDCGDIEYIKKLRGYKVLIAGNHDRGMTNYEEVFDEVYSGPLLIAEDILLSHEPIDVSWAYNIHGHNHAGAQFTKGHMNCCSDVIGYTPINFNKFIKSGGKKDITTIHRQTIDEATHRKRARKKK
jgi:calcineurin-like phosphoesterase family protein